MTARQQHTDHVILVYNSLNTAKNSIKFFLNHYLLVGS